MNWRNIRTYNNSQNNAFEELVCQLARNEKNDAYVKFIKLGAPDGGLEAFWKLKDNSEQGWQAKYVFSIEEAIAQANDSFRTALNTHPELTTFILAVPFDLPDPTYERKGKVIKSGRKKWEDKVKKWKEDAKKLNREMEIYLWDASTLLTKLEKPENEGLRYFWFDKEEFTKQWFNNNLDNAICDLGPRYSPELNIPLQISQNFKYIRRNGETYLSVKKLARKINSFFTDFERLVINYSSELTESIYEIKKKIDNLEILLELDGYEEMKELPLQEIEVTFSEINDLCDNIVDDIREQLQEKFYESRIYKSYRNLGDILYEGQTLFADNFKLLNNPFVLLYGEAGSGKSHLLADICVQLKNNNIPSIFLLGEQFSSINSPREQIRELLQITLDFESMLGVLNSIGQVKGERILIIIDALNEGDGNILWPKYLPGLVNQIKKFPWIGFIASVRSEYKEEIIPKELINSFVQIRHTGFDEMADYACDSFFNYYDIAPEVPVLSEEFTNPLYLKLFCESYDKNKQYCGLPGLSDVFESYTDNINLKLSKIDNFGYDESLNRVHDSIHAIAIKMVEMNSYALTYRDATDIIREIDKKYNIQNTTRYKSFLDALIKENIFKCNRRYREKEKYVSFSYEKMRDYYLVYYQLMKKPEGERIDEYIRNSPYFSDVFEKRPFAKLNKITMLSLLLPEIYDVELMQCVPDGKIPRFFVECFLDSLIWRRDKRINPKIVDWVKDICENDGELRNIVVKHIMNLCALPQSPFNISFIHENFLITNSMGKRDAWWNELINECYDRNDPYIFRRIINWSWKPDRQSNISTDSRKLLGITLLWFCASTNRELRDSASKGLVCLYKSAPREILELFYIFQDIDDLYILERLFAVTYGIVMFSDKKEDIKSISDYLLCEVFEKPEIIPHIIIRDYARGIVEFALSQDIYDQELKAYYQKLITPPYKSKFPMRFPSKKTIEKMCETYKDDIGFSEVKSSMDTGVGYGDFGRYIFGNTLKKFKGIDLDKLERWVIKRIMKLGYDPKIHDKKRPTYYGRGTSKIERIGKKYQWIAFYEIVALVADKYLIKPEWGEKEGHYCSGTLELGLRQFDPTLLIKGANILPYEQPVKSWISNRDYLSSNNDEQEWITEKIPSVEDLIQFQDTNGEDWIALCHFPIWNEYPDEIENKKQEDINAKQKKMYGYINSFLIPNSNVEEFIEIYDSDSIKTKDALNLLNWRSVYFKEYYWSTTYKKTNENRDIGLWNHLVIDDTDTNIIYANTAQRHIWEAEYDYSKNESSLAFDIPTEILYKGMNMHYEGVPEYYCGNEMVCYNPGVNQQSNYLLLIKKKSLSEWLKKNNLCMFWLVTIEKKIVKGHMGSIQWSDWKGMYTLSDDGIHGEIEQTDYSL